MKTFLSIAIAAGSLASLAGCSFAARSPEMYRDETKTQLESKSNDIRACYDAVLKGTPGAQGTVTVKFDVETEQGKIVNIAVDPANTTAPPPVAECVTNAINGLGITPPDSNTGQATFTWQFTAPPPPSAPGLAPKT